jgi:hypothetical protein
MDASHRQSEKDEKRESKRNQMAESRKAVTKHSMAKKMKKHGGMGKMWEKKSEEQKKYGAWGKRPDGSYPR